MLVSSGKCVPAAFKRYGNIVRRKEKKKKNTYNVYMNFRKTPSDLNFSAVDKSSLSLSNTRFSFKHWVSPNAGSRDSMCISVHDEILFGAAPTQHIVSLSIHRRHTAKCFLLLYTFEKHYIHMNSVLAVFFFIFCFIRAENETHSVLFFLSKSKLK